MIVTERSQSLTEFRQTAAETLERLNRTGEAEVITVDGEARAVLLSPAVYDEMVSEARLSRDVEVIRRSLQQYEAGDYEEADAFFDRLRAKLLAMKAAAEKGPTG